MKAPSCLLFDLGIMESWKDKRAFVPFAAVKARRCRSVVLNQDNTALRGKTM